MLSVQCCNVNCRPLFGRRLFFLMFDELLLQAQQFDLSFSTFMFNGGACCTLVLHEVGLHGFQRLPHLGQIRGLLVEVLLQLL
jgi:hypothetical protein